jgi:hypothetical protein
MNAPTDASTTVQRALAVRSEWGALILSIVFSSSGCAARFGGSQRTSQHGARFGQPRRGTRNGPLASLDGFRSGSRERCSLASRSRQSASSVDRRRCSSVNVTCAAAPQVVGLP